MSITFKLRPSEEVFKITQSMEELNDKIEAEEERIAEILSEEDRRVQKHSSQEL